MLHTPTITPSQARAKEIHDRLRDGPKKAAPIAPPVLVEPQSVKVIAINTPLMEAYAKIAALHMELAAAKREIYDLKHPRHGRVTVDHVIAAVAGFYEITKADLISHRRSYRFTHPRHICMFIASVLTVASLADIGRKLGRDHTTVIHGARKAHERLTADETIRSDVEAICQSLGSSPDQYQLRCRSNGEQQCTERHPTLMQPSQNLSVPSPG